MGRKPTHGYTRVSGHHPLYRIWSGMIGRCETPSAGGYENYGGRGICVCKEWRHDAGAFIEWALASGWRRGLQIDREDNDGDYSPSNCRFVTARTNARNKRSNRRIEFNGESLLLVEWAEKLGVSYDVLNQRVNILKWPIARALTQPLMSPTEKARCCKRALRLTHKNLTMTLSEWAERTGVSRTTLWARLKNGWTVAESLTVPLGGKRVSA